MALLVLSCGGYTISRSLCDNASHGWWWPLAQTVVEGIAVDGEALIRMVRKTSLRHFLLVFCFHSGYGPQVVRQSRIAFGRAAGR